MGGNQRRGFEEVDKSPEDKNNMDNKSKRATRSNPPTCTDCDQPFTETETTLTCGKCGDIFHLDCAGIQSKYTLELLTKNSVKWMCFECNLSTLNYVNTVKTKLETLEKTFSQINTQFSDLKKITSAYEQVLKGVNERVDAIEASSKATVSDLQRQIDALSSTKSNNDDVSDLRQIIDQMQQEIRELKSSVANGASFDQSSGKQHQDQQINYLRSLQRRNNLVVQGIPMSERETEEQLAETVIKIGGACGVQLSLADMKSVHRIQKLRSQSRERTQPVRQKREAPILIKFVDNSNAREKLFLRYLELLGKGTPLRCSSIGLETGTRIYVNHHLSPELVQTRNRAITLKKAGIVKRVTPRYNVVRVEIGNQWYKAGTVEALKNIVRQELKQDMDDLIPPSNRTH